LWHGTQGATLSGSGEEPAPSGLRLERRQRVATISRWLGTRCRCACGKRRVTAWLTMIMVEPAADEVLRRPEELLEEP
jgi:hypothetical protein